MIKGSSDARQNPLHFIITTAGTDRHSIAFELHTKALDILEDGDKVLISEGCTHHRQCDDIGTVKIPRWLKEYTGKELIIETS